MSWTDIQEIIATLMRIFPVNIEDQLNGNEKSLLVMYMDAVHEIKSDNGDLNSGLSGIESVIDRVWEYLNIGKWNDVPSFRGALYSYASFVKIVGLLKSACSNINDDSADIIRRSLNVADLGLLLGGSLRSELKQASSLLSMCLNIDYPHEITFFSQLPHKIKVDEIKPDDLKCNPVVVHNCPSLEFFYIHFFKQRTPLKFTGCIDHWPALTRWNDIRYMYKILGPRTIPVELGSSYDSSNWSQKLMTGAQFIDNYIIREEEQSSKGYLAQHQLFNQIPELLDDIRELEYCCLHDDSEKINETGTDINIWFGPHKTISPFHHDARHNILAQVIGSKRILLYSPKWSDNLYPYGEDGLLCNTAQVDPLKPDYIRYPKFKDKKPIECILEPGEMLYIPPKWWHHVVSLSASISVNFWWSLPHTD